MSAQTPQGLGKVARSGLWYSTMAFFNGNVNQQQLKMHYPKFSSAPVTDPTPNPQNSMAIGYRRSN